MTLEGRTVLVTGALGDIGRAISVQLAAAGARLALNDLHEEAAAADFLETLAAEALYVRADVARRGEAESLVERALGRFGALDICIGNAAIVEPQPFLEIDGESWSRQLDVNLDGCFHVGQAAARAMVKAGQGGRILFISSWVQDVPSENIAAYCVSKSGLKMLARCMALELGRHNISVNLVAPGFVDAGLSGRIFQANPGLKEQAQKLVPLGYIMSAGEVAAAVLMLCSPAARYMTGSTLLIDGGNSLFLRGANP